MSNTNMTTCFKCAEAAAKIERLQRERDQATVIVGELAALIPLSEAIDATRTGAALVQWFKEHLRSAPETSLNPLYRAKQLLHDFITLAEIGDADDDANWHEVLEEARAFTEGRTVETSVVLDRNRDDRFIGHELVSEKASDQCNQYCGCDPGTCKLY